MIECHARDDGGLDLGMFFEHPAIYLDHGALGMILDDSSLTDRFTSAMVAKRATLCLSWMGLYEFCRTSELTASRAQAVLEVIYPRLFFVEINPWTVIQRENELLRGGPPVAPHADMEAVKALIGLSTEPSGIITIRGLLSAVRANDLDGVIARLTDTFIDRVLKLRDEFRANPRLRSLSATVPRGPGAPAGTRFLVPEVLRAFVRTPTSAPTRNDAIDFLHTVVPVAYADYVALDAHWATQARQAIERLRKAGHRAHFARVFGGRGHGVDALLTLLES